MALQGNLIITEIRNRNTKVFENLYIEYSGSLVRFAEGYIFDKAIAEDIVQNLFIHIWDKAESITIDHSLKAYLFQATRNRCLDQIRNLQVRDRHELLYMEGLLNSSSTDEGLDLNSINKIKKAMGQLPEKMLHIFKLKYLQGLRFKEIASLLNISENTVKTQLKRAKLKIRELSSMTITYLFLSIFL